MRNSHVTHDLSHLKRSWDRFATDSVLTSELEPAVARSWQRCAPLLNPLGVPQWIYVSDRILPLTRSQRGSMWAIACPIMEDVYQSIEGVSAVLVLTDNTTCALALCGHPSLQACIAELGLKQGAFLDETRIGTNGVALALIESGPVQVVGPEHFLRVFHVLSTAAAPIFDLEGHPVGAIGMIEPVAEFKPHALGVVVAAAKAIENQLQAELLVGEANSQASVLNTTLDAISEGAIAWTSAGTVLRMNNQAGHILGLRPTAAVGRPLGDYVTFPENLARAIAVGEELTDTEASLGVGGGQRECLVSLRMIRDTAGKPTIYIATLRRISEVHQLVTRFVGAQARLGLDDIVGRGPSEQRVRRQALSAARGDAPVLLVGESGTGKNPMARAVHNSSKRAAGPFLAMTCRAIPRQLVLEEFLGFEAGGLRSGPATGQPSKFELADGGTLFLEEIEALPLEMQAALSRVIESGEVIRLGGTRTIPVDVRVIASTETDLEMRMAEDAFRPDLFFRLSSFVIRLPPLREEPENIPILIERLLAKLSLQIHRPLTISKSAKEILCAYPWPGNTTELESVMERAALHCESHMIGPEHLPDVVRQPRAKLPSRPRTEPVLTLQETEKAAILRAGHAARGSLSRTAVLLGIGRTTLWRKMKQLGLCRDDFRSTTTS